jgi:hypothetical protein
MAITYPIACPSVEAAAAHAQHEWGIAPLCVLACVGGTDQHWQLWHPLHRVPDGVPSLVLADGWLDAHPDAPALL